MLNRPNLSPEEYRNQWDKLRQQYPEMETVLLAKQGGVDQQEAFAWTVLGRIPPGMTDNIAEMVGMKAGDITKFYESKGDLTLMSESDRLRFMAAVIDVSALLDAPSNAIRAEWNTAGSLYGDMKQYVESQFGPDIYNNIDLYFQLRDPENPDAGRAFLQSHPQVSDALDMQQQLIQNTPLLAAYYTSLEKIQQYYKQQLSRQAEGLFGPDLWNTFEVYSRLKDMNEDKAAAQWWKDHPELGGYMDLKEEWLPRIDSKVAEFAQILPEAQPPVFRGEQDPEIPASFYTSDTSEAWIASNVLSYANSYTNYNSRRPDLAEFIRKDADGRWPRTRNVTDGYYKLLETSPGDASQYLLKHPEISGRIVWETERLRSLQLAREGDLTMAAQAIQQPAQQEGTNMNITPALQRLIQDAQAGGEPLPQFVLDYLQQ